MGHKVIKVDIQPQSSFHLHGFVPYFWLEDLHPFCSSAGIERSPAFTLEFHSRKLSQIIITSFFRALRGTLNLENDF